MSANRNRSNVFKILHTYNAHLVTLNAKKIPVFARNVTHYEPKDKIS